MTKRAWSAAAATALLLSLATACGGDGGRPSVDEVSEGIRGMEGGGEVDKELADCMAKVYHDSDLSDGALRAIAEGDEDYKASKKDEEIASETAFGEEVAKCTKAMTEDLTKELEEKQQELEEDLDKQQEELEKELEEMELDLPSESAE